MRNIKRGRVRQTETQVEKHSVRHTHTMRQTLKDGQRVRH